MEEKDKFKKIDKVNEQPDEERTELDDFENQKFTDDIPREELRIKAEQEKNKRETQDSSLNEQKNKLEEMWTNRIKR